MGLVYEATLTPTKHELVAGWMPSRPWAPDHEITGKAGEYRLDDPAGDVGVETILFTMADGNVVQVPLTYRSAPLEGADDFLVGTSDHSVLGKRWVYDGCGDPVWAATLATAILTGAAQSQMYLERDGGRLDIPPRVQVRGSGETGAPVPAITEIGSVADRGATTVVTCGDLEIVVARIVGSPIEAGSTLNGTWKGGDGVLAGVRPA
jgi:Maltokinase N-terminal cap domain